MTNDFDLAVLRKQIEMAEIGVERQRRIVEGLKRKGHSAMVAEELLFAFQRSLRAHRATYGFLMRHEAMQKPRSTDRQKAR